MPKDRAVFQPWTYTPTIKINDLDSTTDRFDADVVMQEPYMPRVSNQLGRTSLVELILTPA